MVSLVQKVAKPIWHGYPFFAFEDNPFRGGNELTEVVLPGFQCNLMAGDHNKKRPRAIELRTVSFSALSFTARLYLTVELPLTILIVFTTRQKFLNEIIL